MRIEDVKVRKADLKDRILPKLVGSVFHVTSASGFDGIAQTGLVFANQDGSLGDTYPQSAIGYGRNRGYVCLFDLRETDPSRVDRALEDFYFLDPFSDRRDPVFLFMRSEEYVRLIPWECAKDSREMFIWHVEAWYPGDMPVATLDHVLRLKIERPPDGPHIAALRAANRRRKPDTTL